MTQKESSANGALNSESIHLFLPPDLNSHQFQSSENLKRLVAKSIDHTLLRADASQKNIEQTCKEALQFGFYSVCINPCFVPLARKILDKSSVKTITVVGFPLGANTTATKTFEAEKSIENGAQEIDMVIAIGQIKSGNWKEVEVDIDSVRKACEKTPLKVILETSTLTDEEIEQACKIALQTGASFVKTSTGFSSSGATTRHVRLMRNIAQAQMGVKASGGIKTLTDALSMLHSGANRLGTSSSCQILSQIQANSYEEFLKSLASQPQQTSQGGY